MASVCCWTARIRASWGGACEPSWGCSGVFGLGCKHPLRIALNWTKKRHYPRANKLKRIREDGGARLTALQLAPTKKAPSWTKMRLPHPGVIFQPAPFNATQSILGLKDICTRLVLRKQVFLRVELEVLIICDRVEIIGEIN
jgi:hypothetical protein